MGVIILLLTLWPTLGLASKAEESTLTSWARDGALRPPHVHYQSRWAIIRVDPETVETHAASIRLVQLRATVPRRCSVSASLSS